MFSDARLLALKECFQSLEEESAYKSDIDKFRNDTAKTIISKGPMFNVLPFEREQHGDKVKGKAIPEPIIHDDCYIYRLDGQGRVSLSERMSAFLKVPSYFSTYTYCDEYIEHMYGCGYAPYRVERAFLENGKVKEVLCWAAKSCVIDVYHYDGDVLKRIQHFSRQHKDGSESKFDLEFIYDKKCALACIHRVWPSGRKETTYSTMKINYKLLGQQLYSDIEKAVTVFLQEHGDEHFVRFAMDCYTGHGHASLCIDTNPDMKFAESPADWKYCAFSSLPLVEFPLDNDQTAKLQKTMIQVAVDLLKTAPCFQSLMADNSFRIYVFDHN